MLASSYHSCIFFLWNLKRAWCEWLASELASLYSFHSLSTLSYRSFPKSLAKACQECRGWKVPLNLKSFMFQTLSSIPCFCYEYTHGVASMYCINVTEYITVKEPLTCLLAFSLRVIAFFSFPSALDISSELGKAGGHCSWNFWYSSIINMVLFLPPVLGERWTNGPIARFVVLQRPKIFLAWPTYKLAGEDKVVEKKL